MKARTAIEELNEELRTLGNVLVEATRLDELVSWLAARLDRRRP